MTTSNSSDDDFFDHSVERDMFYCHTCGLHSGDKVMIMKRIRPIKTEADYKEALELLEELIDAEPAANTPEAEQLDILSSLIERYEENKYQIDAPNAIEAIKFVMEQRNLEPKDLIPFIGSKSRVSEVLSGKRSLSIEMIRSLESGLGIPSKVLLKKTDTELEQAITDVFITIDNYGTAEEARVDIRNLVAAEKTKLLQSLLEKMPKPVDMKDEMKLEREIFGTPSGSFNYESGFNNALTKSTSVIEDAVATQTKGKAQERDK